MSVRSWVLFLAALCGMALAAATGAFGEAVAGGVQDLLNAGAGGGGADHRVLHMGPDGAVPRECDTTPCFRKCCPLGQRLDVDTDLCVPTNMIFDPYVFPEKNLSDLAKEDYYILVSKHCVGEWVFIEWKDTPTEGITTDILSNGSITIFEWFGSPENVTNTTYGLTEYCVEYTENEETESFLCTDRTQEARAFAWLYTFGLVVSVGGLLTTLAVYLAVEALRDLHGKSLVGHVGTLAVAYTLLIAVQVSGDGGLGPASCRGVAFAIQFFLLCSFFWLHVMCIDALWGIMEATGSSPIPYPRAKKWIWVEQKRFWIVDTQEMDGKSEAELKEKDKNVERRAFAGYCLYVSCLSLLPVLLTSVQALSPTIPQTYLDYNMKLHNCAFESKTSTMPYFLPLVAVIEMINIIIFTVILVKAWSFHWNTRGLQRVPKQKARMCFLLFVLMSSNWITDVISWSLGGKKVAFIMLHGFNILEGLVTFCIFVLEDRVKDCVKRRLSPQLKTIKQNYNCCQSVVLEDNTENLDETTVMLTNVCSSSPKPH